MGAPVETELKLAVRGADLPALRRRLAAYGRGRRREVDSVYYDTPEALLAREHVALRVRRDGRRWVQTVKAGRSSAPLASRHEWEAPAPGGRLQRDAIDATPLGALLRQAGDAPLAPVFRTRFVRTTWDVRHAGAEIEIALDTGAIEAGDRRLPFDELELELRAGPAPALLDLALHLAHGGAKARTLALLPWGESKAARGVRLAQGRAPAPVKADARRIAGSLEPGMTPAVALRTLLARGTEVLLANVHGMREAEQPEFVHQARVALRRMRAAVRALTPATDFPALLARELKWIAGQLGRLRDWDVLTGTTLPAIERDAADTQRAAVKRLVAAAARRRAGVRSRAHAALAGPRFACLALRLLQWAASEPPEEPGNLRLIAARSLERAQRRVTRAARRFERADAAGRHRARVLVKRLRYTLDLFACAGPPPAGVMAADACVSLQETLGAMNDAVVAAGLVRGLPDEEGAREIALDWLHGADRSHRRRAARELRALIRKR
jgi:inorganic triphosphatase YgiF